jgi:hypothetical protein
MPTATYDPIASVTLASEATNITFSSITSAYTDLRLIFVGVKPSATASSPIMRFNSDSGSNYGFNYMFQLSGGIGTSSDQNTSYLPVVEFDGLTILASPKSAMIDIFSYSLASGFKSTLHYENSDRNGAGRVYSIAGCWRSTAAINNISIFDGSGRNFGVGTRATLYGILRA